MLLLLKDVKIDKIRDVYFKYLVYSQIVGYTCIINTILGLLSYVRTLLRGRPLIILGGRGEKCKKKEFIHTLLRTKISYKRVS